MVTGKPLAGKTLNESVPNGPHSQKPLGRAMAASAAVRNAPGARPESCWTLLILTAVFAGMGVGPRLLRWSIPYSVVVLPKLPGNGQVALAAAICASVSEVDWQTPKISGASVGTP